MKEIRLSWLGHVSIRSDLIKVKSSTKTRGCQKRTLVEALKNAIQLRFDRR